MNETHTASGPYIHETRHLFGVHCPECMAHYIHNKNLETVELWFEHGMITGDALDAYRHVWVISATRSKRYDGWLAYPADETARYIAKRLVELIPGGRAYC